MLRPWLLLLLAEKPAHGYELMERLDGDEGTPVPESGLLYRILRQFEAEGLVRSSWETRSSGPARRVYEITPQGLEHLHTWSENIRQVRQRADRFLADYESRFGGGTEQ